MLLSLEVGGNFNAEEVRVVVNIAKALFLIVLPVSCLAQIDHETLQNWLRRGNAGHVPQMKLNLVGPISIVLLRHCR